MPDRWVIDEDYPAGHLVPMTDDEEAQLERDRAAHAVVADAERAAEDAAAARLADLRRARIELAQRRTFSWLTDSERDVLDMLLAESASPI